MLSRFIFGVVFSQWLMLGAGWLAGVFGLVLSLFIQASPVWVWVYLRHPAVLNGEREMPFFLIFSVLYCVFKYTVLARALFREGLNPFTFLTLAGEAGYVLFTMIYLYQHNYF